MRYLFLVLATFFTLVNAQAQQANLFTIPNQSAQYIRMPSRATMVDVDAVYFNPANLPDLGNGFHISISNQVLSQTSKIRSDYQLYNEHPKNYEGKVSSFIFPSIFLNWNINKTSFHGAFVIVGGAGGVDYANLPISDRGIADVPYALTNSSFGLGTTATPSIMDYDAANGTTYSQIADYRFDFSNKGLGFSPGYQFGIAHKLNKYFSFGMDFRYMQQTFSSEGEVANIEILPNTADPSINNWISPGDYLRLIGNQTGVSSYVSYAGVYDDLGGDRFINIRQKGSGFTFIPSVLIKPTDKLSIALKYEHKTKVVLKTLVRDGKDGGIQYNPTTGEREPIFVDGEKSRADLPGFVSWGVGYQVLDKWRINVGGRYMFFNGVDFNGREAFLNKSYYELEFATEYQVAKKFLVSAGYTFNKANVDKEYHNDVDFWIPGHTVGFGGRIDFTQTLSFDFGAMITRNVSKSFTYDNHYYADGVTIAGKPANYDNSYTMDFKKNSFIIGLGLNIKIKSDKNKTRFIDDEEAEETSDLPYNFRG